MISKEEAREKLKKAGYNVVDDNSVLTVLISEKASVKNTVKAVKELLLKIDYQASFGVRQHSKSDEEMNPDSETDVDMIDDEDVLVGIDTDIYADDETEAATEEIPAKEKTADAKSQKEKPAEDKQLKEEPIKAKPTKEKPAEDKQLKEKSTKAKPAKEKPLKTEPVKEEALDEDDFLDEEDESFDEGSISLDDYDMDMMLNEKSIQFSLEDFGLI